MLSAKKTEKILFIAYGFLNFLITNITLLALLLILPVYASATGAVIVNLLLGYALNRHKVFGSRKLLAETKTYILRYASVAIGAWLIYTLGIPFISSLIGCPKGTSALILIPVLTLYSYFLQSRFVFQSRA